MEGELLPTYREKRENKTEFALKSRCQRTISKKISISGVGLFLGEKVSMTFVPAEVGTGIVFKRVDLPEQPTVEACVKNLKATPRCTIIGVEDVTIQCVEHVLSALFSCKVDNLIIELDKPELPIFDGSAKFVIEMLQEVGVIEQNQIIDEYFLQKPIYVSSDEMSLIAIPSSKLKYSYTLSYPNHPLLDSQFHSFAFSEERYCQEIAPCRTFAPLNEVEDLIAKQMIKHTSLSTGIILDGDKAICAEGLRFSNEMARHKLLDLIGDLALVGRVVIAHFISIRSGHFINTVLARKLYEKIREI